MLVLNITRHKTTHIQKEHGVVDIPNQLVKRIILLGTFTPVPDSKYLQEAARAIVYLIYQHVLDTYPDHDLDSIACMCGFAPYFNGVIDHALIEAGFKPCYPFTHKRTYIVTNPVTNLRTKTYEHEFLGLVYNT